MQLPLELWHCFKDNAINSISSEVKYTTALIASIAALHQQSVKPKVTCGSRTEVYSNRFGLGADFNSTLSERLDVNAGTSMTFGENTKYGGGTFDSIVVKKGFTYSLGSIKNPLRSDENEKFEARLEVLKRIALGGIQSEGSCQQF